MPTVTYMSTMTPTRHPGRAALTEPPDRRAPHTRLVSGRLALALLSSVGALTSFYLLLSVTPMYAVSAGAGSAEAGVVTGSLMLATVLAEFASARLMRRYGYRRVFAVGALLLGGQALALLGPHSVIAIVAVSIARGAGFGLNTVVIGALVATALPPDRRGEGIGLAGVVACLPAIVALPSGIWLAENAGYAVVISDHGRSVGRWRPGTTRWSHQLLTVRSCAWATTVGTRIVTCRRPGCRRAAPGSAGSRRCRQPTYQHAHAGLLVPGADRRAGMTPGLI